MPDKNCLNYVRTDCGRYTDTYCKEVCGRHEPKPKTYNLLRRDGYVEDVVTLECDSTKVDALEHFKAAGWLIGSEYLIEEVM